MRENNLVVWLFLIIIVLSPLGDVSAKEAHHDNHAHQDHHDDHDDHEDHEDHEGHETHDDHGSHEDDGTIKLTKEEQDLGGIKTETIGTRAFQNKIAILGKVAQDPEKTAYITPSEALIIQSCAVSIGSAIKQGDVLCLGLNRQGKKHSVVATFNGVIIAQLVQVGQSVDPLNPIFVVANMDQVGVNFDVYERDAAHVILGQKVLVYAHAWPQTQFMGVIQYISTRIDPESHVLRIKVLVENDQHKLRLGMSVRGDILVAENPGEHVVVPSDAIQTIDGKTVVFVQLNEATFEAKEISVMSQDNEIAAISGDIDSKAIIVTEGSFILKSQMLASEMEHAHSH